MTKTLKELGNLKRSLEVEIPYEDIKSSYDNVFSQVKSVNLRGFRPGKHPKGWVKKRFIEQMTAEAREQVIPQRFNEIAEEMKLRPATQAVIEDLSFDAKKPMTFKLSFEVQPDLASPDYEKLKLEKQEAEVKKEDVETMLENLRKNFSTTESKAEGSAAEDGDRVVVDFKRTIGEKTFEQTDQRFDLDKNILPEIKSNILGMHVGDSKEFSFTATEEYLEEHAGEKVSFEITVKEMEAILLPEMNEDFFKNFEGAKNEEEFRAYAEKQIREQKERELRFSYYDDLKKQLLASYDEFELPEELLANHEKQQEEELRKANPEISDEELESSKSEKMNQFKETLRTDYILQQIAISESLAPNEEAIAQQFASMAQMYGSHPAELYQSQLGPILYRQIARQASEEAVLDFLVKRIFGEPLEEPPAEAESQTVSE
ncbi:MAG: trigger factor [SAR324 cluster bacterium]|nr:trigger factor [SAR324 cluster bacterium]